MSHNYLIKVTLVTTGIVFTSSLIYFGLTWNVGSLNGSRVFNLKKKKVAKRPFCGAATATGKPAWRP